VRNVLIALCFFTVAINPVTTFAKEKTNPAEFTAGGLKLVPNTGEIGRVWAKPGIDLTRYKRYYLVEPAVAFRKNWLQDQNKGHPSLRVTARDMENIKNDIKDLFIEVFNEELLGASYTVSEVTAEDVMIIKPAILDLDINAPDLNVTSTTDTLASSAGSMTLYMELYDSVTEELLVKAVDSTSDQERGIAQWQTSVANRAAARRMMKPWVKALREGFNISPGTTGK
jgi:hypothetical protein